MRQGLLGNRLHGRPEKDRRADAVHAWRRRSDRAGTRFGEEGGAAGQARQGDLLPRRTARPHRHDARPRQRRPARLSSRLMPLASHGNLPPVAWHIHAG
ncbi:hypothetical protein G6F57_020207 [Rhizopus arrhizus]|nr:hypothetical protein G6F57_020207 [Rhizopus arrhizus]